MNAAFNAMLVADAKTMAQGEFGESATYAPVGGAPIPVNVVANRGNPESLPGQSEGFTSPAFTVFLPAGQGVTFVDTGGDTITLPKDIGGAATPFPVLKVIHQDPGGWTLKLI